MTRVWSEQAKFESWLAVELAVLDAWAQIGTIPAEAARVVRERARVPTPEQVAERERTTNHDVAAFVDTVAAGLGEEGRWFHYGLTSSDVVDTALSLTVQAAGELVLDGVERAIGAVDARAREHRATVMIGRTHGVHAEPTTFGLKLVGWAFQLERDRDRIEHALTGMRVGKLSGAVGTYATTTPEVERLACESLGLDPAPSSTQILQRDRHAELLSALAILASSLDRFALEIRHLARTEVREVEEPFGRGQKGSSAMPHKRNPIVAERICGLARLVRGLCARRPRERRPVARARHLALLGRAGRASRRLSRRRLHARSLRLARRGAGRAPGANAGEPRGDRWALLQPATAACARRLRARPRLRRIGWCSGTRCVPGTRVSTSGSSCAQTAEIATRVDLDEVFDLSAYTRHVDVGLRASRPDDAQRRPTRERPEPCTSRAGKVREIYRRRRRDAPARRERPYLDVRRRPADADSRQGPRAHAGSRRSGSARTLRPRAEPPRRPRRRRSLDDLPAARDASGRVRRARLSRGIGLEGLPHDRRDLRARASGRPAGVGAASRSRSSRRRRRPSRGTTRTSTRRRRRRSAASAATRRRGPPRSPLYRYGAARAEERGILLADTKFEFGVAPDGGVVLGDEAMTPDSSRFWDAADYAPGGPQPSFDKQFVRDWCEQTGWDKEPPGPELPDAVVDGTRARYVEAFERLTGIAVHRLRRRPGGRAVKATVLVRPKGGILDPQGDAVGHSLRKLGFDVRDRPRRPSGRPRARGATTPMRLAARSGACARSCSRTR